MKVIDGELAFLLQNWNVLSKLHELKQENPTRKPVGTVGLTLNLDARVVTDRQRN